MASDQNSLLSFNAGLTYNARAPMQPLSDGGGDRPYLRSQSSKSRGCYPPHPSLELSRAICAPMCIVLFG